MLMINSNDVVGFKFVRHGAVAGTRYHRSHAVTLLHEVFFTDRIVKTLTHGNVTKGDTVTAGIVIHAKYQRR